jgi:hypothetical protein
LFKESAGGASVKRQVFRKRNMLREDIRAGSYE